MLNKAQTKKVQRFLDMLFDLRAMGTDPVQEGGRQQRAINFRPFALAVASNITAFFNYAPVKDTFKVYQLTQSWFTPRQLESDRVEHQYNLSKMCQDWMMRGRTHPTGVMFAAKHLLNVITLWPLQPPQPSVKRLASRERAKAKRQERMKKEPKC